MRFKDKICLVTGGTSGIGRATSIQFAKEGAQVVLIGRNEDEGKEVEDIIRNDNGEATFIKVDISHTDEIAAVVKKIVEKFGRIDVLVNDAAMMTFKPVIELSEKEWDDVLDTNLKAPFLFCKHCLPHMNNAVIINVSSVHAHQSTSGVIPYAVSKAGLEALTRGISREYPPEKVRVNCVAPGAIDTPMLWNNPNIKSGKEKLDSKPGKPEDVAKAICFLASDDASFINGTTLIIDNGKLNEL